MSANATAHLLFGIEINRDQFDIAELDPDLIKGVDVEMVGNGIMGDNLAYILYCVEHSLSEHQDGATALGSLPVPDACDLCKYAESLGIENPQPQWFLGLEIG